MFVQVNTGPQVSPIVECQLTWVNEHDIMALIKMHTVKEEFARNPELKEADLDLLRDWHAKQPHLPPMSDSELILFLHSNYYRIEPTKTTIDTFYTARSHVPEFLTNRDPLSVKELRAILKVVCCMSLPQATPEGYQVITSKLIDCETSHFVFADALKLFSMIMELSLYTSGPAPGHIIIIDMQGVVLGHVARLSPILLKNFFYYLQEAIPVRLKGLHFINTVPFMGVILNMMKPFMKTELMDVLHFHRNIESLRTKIPLEILSNEQGGKAGPLDELWAAEVRKLEEHRAWFQDEDKRKAREADRPSKAKNGTELLGVEGSFKKLDID